MPMFRTVAGRSTIFGAVALAGVLTLTGCSSSSSSSASSSGGGSSTGVSSSGSGSSRPSTGKSIVYIPGQTTNDFYVTLSCGVQKAASAAGYDATIQGAAAWDPQAQTTVLNSVIAKHPSAIIITPTDSKSLVAPLKQASEAGIKIVVADTTLSDTSFVASSVASDNTAGGADAATALAGLVADKGKVVIIGATPGVSTADQRVQGFEDKIKTYGDIDYLGVQPSTPSGGVAEATRLTAAALAKDPDITGIFAVSSNAGDGANAAIRSAGLAGKVKVVEFDAGKTQVDQLKSGLVQALIAQKPAEIGEKSVEQAIAAIQGEKTETTIGTTSVILTNDNIDANGQYVYGAGC